MHISDGVLSSEVLVGGYVAATVGVAINLRGFDPARAPSLGVMTSLFFAASALKVPLPVGMTSVHLVLNGLLGILLGGVAWPCIAVALLFQFLFLLHGGITSLGVNIVVLGVGASVAQLIFRCAADGAHPRRTCFVAFVATMVAVIVSALLMLLVLYTGGHELVVAGGVSIVLPQVLIAIVEGLLSASAVAFVLKVKPDLLRLSITRAPGIQRL